MLTIWRRQFYFPLFLLLSVSATQAVGMMLVKLPRPQSLALLASISRTSRLSCSSYYALGNPVEKTLTAHSLHSPFISLSQIFASQDGVILVATVTSQVVHAPRG